MRNSRILIVLFVIGALLIMSACGNDAATKESTTVETNGDRDSTQHEDGNVGEGTELEMGFAPLEPGADEVCAYCNMVVYHEEHEMGAFTAQLVTADGAHYFFDDVGCMLNFQRELDAEVVKEWVRDLNTLEWVEYEMATAVAADIKTPMKYGYAFFNLEEEAVAYVEAHPELNPSLLTDKNEIDEIAKERHEKKMQKMQEGGGMDHGDEGDEHHGEDEEEHASH